jgi:DNA-binding CsgD family transcriptional regulator
MALKPRQLALIEAIIANPTASHVELAEIVGINRNTITVYKRDAEFKAELKKRMQEIWEESEVMAVQNMRKLADEGHFQANKYILDSLGYAPAQKIEANVSNDIVINVEE